MLKGKLNHLLIALRWKTDEHLSNCGFLTLFLPGDIKVTQFLYRLAQNMRDVSRQPWIWKIIYSMTIIYFMRISTWILSGRNWIYLCIASQRVRCSKDTQPRCHCGKTIKKKIIKSEQSLCLPLLSPALSQAMFFHFAHLISPKTPCHCSSFHQFANTMDKGLFSGMIKTF